MSVVDDLIAFVVAQDPAFLQRIAGAPPDRIDLLEGLVGKPLPSVYREFLSKLGKNDGGLRIGGASTTRLEAIIEYYQDMARDGDTDQMLPKDCIVVAYVGVGTYDLSLDLGAQGPPTVIYSSGPDKLGLCADSFEKLLFRNGFWRFQLPTYVHRRAYVPTDPHLSLRSVAQVLAPLGFRIEWFADQMCLCATRNDAALVAEVALGQPLHLQLGSTTQSALTHIEASLQKHAGLLPAP